MEEIPYQWVMYHIIIRLVYPETLTYKKLWAFFKLLWVFFLSALLKEIVAAHKPIGIHVYDGIFTYMNEGVDFFWEASWRRNIRPDRPHGIRSYWDPQGIFFSGLGNLRSAELGCSESTLVNRWQLVSRFLAWVFFHRTKTSSGSRNRETYTMKSVQNKGPF